MTFLAFAFPGPTEMIVVGIVAVLLFGRKLPKLAFDLGNSFTQFKKGISQPIQELREEIENETRDFKDEVGAQTREAEKVARDR